MSDTGFNEGAAAAAYAVAQRGLGLPDGISNLAGDGLANVWPRQDMMRFAIWLAKSGNSDVGTAVAVISQWHNCHAFQCLIYHADEVSEWLVQQ